MLDYNTATLIEALYITLDSGYVSNSGANEIREMCIIIILNNIVI